MSELAGTGGPLNVEYSIVLNELSFLIELLLNHKLSKVTRDAVAERIKEVAANTTPIVVHRAAAIQAGPPQAASTLAAMARHAMLEEGVSVAPVVMPPVEAPPPVVNIAQTPAASAALNARNAAINMAISGKVEKGRTSPRKF